MKPKIIAEKTYYSPTFLGNVRHGFLLTRTFIISRTSKRMILRQKRDVIEFKGRKEGLEALKGKKKLPEEADGNPRYIPIGIRKLVKSERKIPLKVEL